MQEQREYKQIVWLRWVAGIIIGVALAVLITDYLGRDNDIAACERTSEFRVIEARVWEKASEQRRADGDIDTAKFYAETARQIRATIPVAPRDFSVPRGEIAKNRRNGCEKAFPPPIPFVE